MFCSRVFSATLHKIHYQKNSNPFCGLCHEGERGGLAFFDSAGATFAEIGKFNKKERQKKPLSRCDDAKDLVTDTHANGAMSAARIKALADIVGISINVRAV